MIQNSMTAVRRRPPGQGHLVGGMVVDEPTRPLPPERRPASRHQPIPPRAAQPAEGNCTRWREVPLPLARRVQRGDDRRRFCRAYHARPHPERGLGRQVDADRLGRQSAVDPHTPATGRRARTRAPVGPASVLDPRPHPLRTGEADRAQGRSVASNTVARWSAASTNTTTRT